MLAQERTVDSWPGWDKFRQQVPVTVRWTYLDNAAVAPIAEPTRAAIVQWSEEACFAGDTAWPKWEQQVEAVRQLAAALINADTGELAFIANTTTGISLVAEGYPWRSGDNVVVLGNEFPSNVYPWMNLASRDVECRRVPVDGAEVDIERVLAMCDARTRIISASWVGYATGWRLDVGELVRRAHARGILVFIDAIQGLGVFPLDVRETEVDFLAADGHKWLMGPEGAGVFYLRKDHLERLRPIGVGWNSVLHARDFSRIDWIARPTASRYEGGSQNMVGIIGLGASLGLLAEYGLGARTSRIADRVLQITDYACQRLIGIGAEIRSSRRAEGRSGIVAFDLPGRDLLREKQRCIEAGIVLSYRAGVLRISPHAYANELDVERLVEVLGDRRTGD